MYYHHMLYKKNENQFYMFNTIYNEKIEKVVYFTENKCLFSPENIDYEQFLCKKEYKHKDKYCYFLHQLYLRRVTDNRVTKDTYIPVHFDMLCSFLTTRHTDKIIQFWLAAGVVERTNQYIVGTKSFGYRFTEAYRNTRSQKVAIADKKFADKLERKRRESMLKIDLSVPQHAFIHYNLQELRVDAVAAYNAAFKECSTKRGKAKQERSFNKWNLAIHAIQNKEWFLTRDKTGKRVHQNWLNFPAKLRSTICLDTGEQLVNVDIRCSQPLMLAILLKKHYTGQALPANVAGYISECEGGTLYKTLADAAGVAITDRKKFKRQFFKRVLYGRNVTAMLSREWQVFYSLYPDVADYIQESKRENYKALSHALQRQESEIIVDGVFAELAQDYYPADYFALPIHDSITVCSDRLDDVKNRLITEFAKYNISPTLNIEYFALLKVV